MPSSADLDVANELADRGAVVAMHWFETGVVAELKADASPVTVADRAVEALLRDGLAERCPGDAILGEEMGASGTSNRTWIIDPIDGTNFFAEGSPYWRIQLALEEDGELVMALVDAPALGLRWWATRGGGAFERDADGVVRRLAVSSTAALPDAVVTYYPHAVIDRLPAGVRLQAWDRFTLPELVRGELEAFYVECCEVWDHAPWVLLVEEAGGRFTDLAGGRSPAERGGLYSNAAVHDALLGAITRP